MRKITLSLILCCMTMGTFAQQPLGGFLYGTEAHPAGTEWEAPEKLSLNKEQPRAYFFSFGDVESAKKVLPQNSKFWQSLDGQWKFHWAPNPSERPEKFYETSYDVSGWDDITVPSCWNVAGIQKDGSLKYGVPIYCNQPVIFKHTVAVGDWKGGVMREPNKDWTTYKYRNEVGSYRRTFHVDEDWKDREVYINFDGVNSFFYIWINGQYVGFSKNSRNTASFDITKYLVKGENTVAVEVCHNFDNVTCFALFSLILVQARDTVLHCVLVFVRIIRSLSHSLCLDVCRRCKFCIDLNRLDSPVTRSIAAKFGWRVLVAYESHDIAGLDKNEVKYILCSPRCFNFVMCAVVIYERGAVAVKLRVLIAQFHNHGLTGRVGERNQAHRFIFNTALVHKLKARSVTDRPLRQTDKIHALGKAVLVARVVLASVHVRTNFTAGVGELYCLSQCHSEPPVRTEDACRRPMNCDNAKSDRTALRLAASRPSKA